MYVVCFSGGKDSTAMLLKLIEDNAPIHSVLYFDTEKEYPEIKEHINTLKQNIDVPFVTVRHWLGFDWLRQRYGEAHASGGWCTAAKRDTCHKYLRLIKKDVPTITECIGFTTDEVARAEAAKKSTRKTWDIRFPLIEAGMSEDDCLRYCEQAGYTFGGIYDWMPNKRTGCYDCPKMGAACRKAAEARHPELYI